MGDERWQVILCTGVCGLPNHHVLLRRVLAAGDLAGSYHMLKKATRLPFAVAVITFIFHAASAQQYTVRLDRLEKAGDRYHLVATSAETTTAEATVSDQLLQKSEDVLTVNLSADVTIIEAGSNNWATRKRFVVLSSKL